MPDPCSRAKLPATMNGWLLTSALVLLSATAAAADPPADRVEILSGGSPESSLYISRQALESLRLSAPVKVSDQLTLTHGGVGYLEQQRDGSYHFIPSKEIPLRTGLQFGWLLRVNTTLSSVVLKEEFSLPRKNQTWTVDPEHTRISADGLTAITEDSMFVWDFLWRAWTLEDGDPAGPHRFKLSLQGSEAIDLQFQIQKPTP